MSEENKPTENNPSSTIEIPELTCSGCIGRDRIIQSLAKTLDEINGIIPQAIASKDKALEPIEPTEIVKDKAA